MHTDTANDANERGPGVPGADATEPSDVAILRRLAAGGVEDFDLFVDRYKPQLLTYLYHRLGDAHRSEDLLQEVFLRAFRSAGSVKAKHDAGVRAWLFTIARNCLIDYQRSRRRRPLRLATDDHHEPDQAAVICDPAKAMLERELRGRVAVLLDTLPADQRDVVALRLFGNLSFAQIADVVDAPLATVKSRMRYGLNKLRSGLLSEKEGAS